MQRAASHALERRAVVDAEREKRRKAQEEKKWAARYGNTASGEVVSGAAVGQLLELGYGGELAVEALRNANNDIEVALGVLSDPAGDGGEGALQCCCR